MNDASLAAGGLDPRSRRLQAYLLRSFAVAVAGGLVLFLLLRVAAPWLISLHDTLALWAGAACLIASPVVALVTGLRLWSGWRAYRGRA